MVEIIKNLSGSFLISAVVIYIVGHFIDEKIKFNINNLVYFCFAVFTLVINSFYCPPLLRIVVSTIVLIGFCKLFFEIDCIKITCGVIIEQLLFLCSEIMYILTISTMIFFNTKIDVTSTFGTLITNLMISIIALSLARLPQIKRLYKKLVNIFGNLSNKKILGFLGVTILIINLLLGISYFKVNIFVLLIVNGSFIAFVLYILYSILEEKNLNLQYRSENDSLHDSLHNYENMIDQHRVINHENKNQLSLIKGMVEQNDSTTIRYIDGLVNQIVEKDETLLEKTKRIPSGGLQGIIYQKILLMKEKNIPNALNISRDIKVSDFKKLDMDTNIDLCKIVGVFLDNAIDEVQRVKKQRIIVDVYMENGSFCVRVTNNYGPGIDFSKIDNKGYTTKSEGHGYGLALVKEIIKNNPRFSNPRTIVGQSFSQIVKVSDMSIDEL